MSHPIPYGAAVTIYRPMMLAGEYLTSAPTIAAGDVQISKDGGAFANVATLPTWSNGQLAIALSATEAEAEQITLRWVDQTASKEWDDDAAVLVTAGNASALLPNTNVAMRGTDGANTTTPPTAAAIADQVWDEPRSGHTTAGSYGQHTGDAAMRGTDGANTSAPPPAAAVADAVWDEALSGHATAGSAGKALTDVDAAAPDLAIDSSVDDASASTTQFVAAAGLSATDEFYVGMVLVFTSGTLAKLTRPVVDYDGATRRITVSPALPVAPADTNTFLMLGRG